MNLPEAVSQSRRGDQEAMHSLFTTFYGDVYRTTYLVTRNPQLAEEAAQETFIKAFSRLGTLKEPEKFASWLRAIAGRCAIDVLRREKNYVMHDDLDLVAGPDTEDEEAVFPLPEFAAERTELREVMKQALAALEPIHRQVLVLRFYQDLEVNEIAATLDCPVGTVKSRLHRALRALKKQLASWKESGGLD